MYFHILVYAEALISAIIYVFIIDAMIIDVVVFDVGQHEMMLMMNFFLSWWTMMSFEAINLDTKGYYNNNNEHNSFVLKYIESSLDLL